MIQRSTVAIIAYYDRIPRQHATGTLVRFGDHRFVVTAGHAIRQFDEGKKHYSDLRLFLDNGHDADLVPLFGEFLSTKTARDPSDPRSSLQEDQLDVAIWELHEVTVGLLTNKSFLNRRDISITAELTKGIFYFAGFPCDWSTTNGSEQRFDMNTIRSIAHPHQDPSALTDFDPRFHIALNLDQTPPMPASLKGISGCSIWKLADMPPKDGWTSSDAKVVGVQTCVHNKGKAKAVQGTMWRWVVQILVKLRPEIRPALNVWLPGPE